MIPKIIHYAWFGSKIPQNVQERIDNWKKVIPDLEYHPSMLRIYY